ncbi:MAG: ABC transporter ATP-binding protein [Alphaproteobacteria bacterium]|nr:ABC transporter ATP-binding protein [Alphaproteobacteria bacterium]
MVTVHTDDYPAHREHCVRWNEIYAKSLVPEETVKDEMLPVAEIVLEVKDSSLTAMFSGGGKAQQDKANERMSFWTTKGETMAVFWRVRWRQTNFRQDAGGAGNYTHGKVYLSGTNLGDIGVSDRTPSQLASLQMVFQNPPHTAGYQSGQVIKRFGIESNPAKIQERVFQLLDTVKLPHPSASRKPRQLSGGQKQRLGIARAFAGSPKTVISDKTISALDVSVAAAVIELLIDIQRDYHMAILFISHDLSAVHYTADWVVMIYLGQITERNSNDDMFSPPYHPSTEALLSAVPIADPKVTKRRVFLEGNLLSPLNLPKGCPFSTRCPRSRGKLCGEAPPPLQFADDHHTIACHSSLDEFRKVEPVISIPDWSADTADKRGFTHKNQTRPT